jgi:hypothetical protein
MTTETELYETVALTATLTMVLVSNDLTVKQWKQLMHDIDVTDDIGIIASSHSVTVVQDIVTCTYTVVGESPLSTDSMINALQEYVKEWMLRHVDSGTFDPIDDELSVVASEELLASWY